MFRRKSKPPVDNTKELFAKANNKEWREVKKLIKGGIDANSKSSFGGNLYDLARYFSNLRMIRWLLRHGFDPNQLIDNESYLERELSGNTWRYAKVLIQHGARLDIKIQGEDILKYTMRHQQWDLVATILNKGFPFNPKDPLVINFFLSAAKEGQLNVIRVLLKKGVDINARDEEGKNALHHAILGHDLYTNNLQLYVARQPVIRYLISHGIEINAQSSDGNCALKLAIDKKLAYVANLLLANNADIDIKNSETGEPLISESERKKLAKLKQPINGDANTGLSMLMAAEYTPASDYNPDSTYPIRNYLEHGFYDVNMKNQHGNTLLFIAIHCNNKPNCTKALIDYGADVNIDNNGNTAIRLAVQINNPEILKILATHATKINPKDANLLMHALVVYKEWKLVRHLTRHNADLDGLNEKGESLLKLAINQRQWKTARCLLDHGAQTAQFTEREIKRLNSHTQKHQPSIWQQSNNTLFKNAKEQQNVLSTNTQHSLS